MYIYVHTWSYMIICLYAGNTIRVSRNWAPQNLHVLSSCSQIDINWACARRHAHTPFRIPKIGFPANVRPPGNNLTLQTDREAPGSVWKWLGKPIINGWFVPSYSRLWKGHFPGHSVIPKNGPTYMANQQSTLESRDLTIRSVSSTKAVCATPLSQLVMVLNWRTVINDKTKPKIYTHIIYIL